MSLTHHSYLNLDGEGSASIEDHILQVDADIFIPIDENYTLMDQRLNVAGPREDLRAPKFLADVIPDFHLRHGLLYELVEK